MFNFFPLEYLLFILIIFFIAAPIIGISIAKALDMLFGRDECIDKKLITGYVVGILLLLLFMETM